MATSPAGMLAANGAHKLNMPPFETVSPVPGHQNHDFARGANRVAILSPGGGNSGSRRIYPDQTIAQL